MITKQWLPLALAVVITQPALAANWHLTSTADGDKHYLDIDSIKKDYLINGTPVITAWEKWEYKQAQDSSAGKKYWSNRFFDYYDCHARKSVAEYATLYDKQGEVIKSDDNPSFSRYSSANWKRVVPESMGETMLNAVCAYDR